MLVQSYELLRSVIVKHLESFKENLEILCLNPCPSSVFSSLMYVSPS
jgi:hypothetical protein